MGSSGLFSNPNVAKVEDAAELSVKSKSRYGGTTANTGQPAKDGQARIAIPVIHKGFQKHY